MDEVRYHFNFDSSYDEEGIRLKVKYQMHDWDCGHACLKMLGHDGYSIFPEEKPISTKDLLSIEGAENNTLPVGRDEEIDYSKPHVIIILPKHDGPLHWAVRHNNTVYCPSVGEMPAKEYKSKHVAAVLQEIFIPPIVDERTGEVAETQTYAIVPDHTSFEDMRERWQENLRRSGLEYVYSELQALVLNPPKQKHPLWDPLLALERLQNLVEPMGDICDELMKKRKPLTTQELGVLVRSINSFSSRDNMGFWKTLEYTLGYTSHITDSEVISRVYFDAELFESQIASGKAHKDRSLLILPNNQLNAQNRRRVEIDPSVNSSNAIVANNDPGSSVVIGDISSDDYKVVSGQLYRLSNGIVFFTAYGATTQDSRGISFSNQHRILIPPNPDMYVLGDGDNR